MRPRKFECEESYRRNKSGHAYLHEMKERSLSLTLSGEHWTGAIQYNTIPIQGDGPNFNSSSSHNQILTAYLLSLTHSTSPIRFLPGLLTLSLSLFLSVSLASILSTCCIDQLKADGYSLSLSPSLFLAPVILWKFGLCLVFTLPSLAPFTRRDNHHQQSRTRETLGDQSDSPSPTPAPDIKETCEREDTTYTQTQTLASVRDRCEKACPKRL